MGPLMAQDVTLAYDKRVVAEGLDVEIPDRGFTAIVGPNACGKSTLLRALARMLKPRTGVVLLDGHEIAKQPSKEVARRLGLLAQSAIAPGRDQRGRPGRPRPPPAPELPEAVVAGGRARRPARDGAPRA